MENLIDFYLEYNDQHQLHDITVYSVADKTARQHPALQSTVNHYVYIQTDSLLAKLRKRLYHWLHRKEEYYHYTIEYFLHEAIRHIRRQHYDVIILENRPGYALKLQGKTTALLVYHLHNEKLTPQAPHCHSIYDAASRILTVSDYIKSQVAAISPADQKTVCVHNGIDLSAFTSGVSPIARAEKGLSDDDFVMLFSGRITPEKGIMQLVEAMNLLRDYPHIKLLVMGSSFYGNADNENDFARALKAKAEPLRDRILFTGFIPYDQMPAYLQMADMAIVPSVWDDPFPTTVLEAQAVGLPVIATRRGGIPEEVTADSAILLDTDEHFVSNLSAAILDLYHHPERRQAMSQAALQHAQRFSKQRYAEDFYHAIEELK